MVQGFDGTVEFRIVHPGARKVVEIGVVNGCTLDSKATFEYVYEDGVHTFSLVLDTLAKCIVDVLGDLADGILDTRRIHAYNIGKKCRHVKGRVERRVSRGMSFLVNLWVIWFGVRWAVASCWLENLVKWSGKKKGRYI